MEGILHNFLTIALVIVKRYKSLNVEFHLGVHIIKDNLEIIAENLIMFVKSDMIFIATSC